MKARTSIAADKRAAKRARALDSAVLKRRYGIDDGNQREIGRLRRNPITPADIDTMRYRFEAADDAEELTLP